MIGTGRGQSICAGSRRPVANDTADLSISFRVDIHTGAPMPASASLLALVGIVGFALVSMLLGVFS